MKPLDDITILPEEIRIVAQKQIEKQKLLFTRTQMHKGHTMYEINCHTGEINEAKYKEEKIVFVPDYDLLTGTKTGEVPKKAADIDCKENCLYIGALNKKSAIKKFIKYLYQNASIRNEKNK